jgi:hypothetical protein
VDAGPDVVRVLGEAREGVGVRLAVRTRVLNVPAFTDVLEVVRWEPPRLLQVAHLGAVRGAAAWRLDPLAAGTTRFTWTEDVRVGGGPLGEVALLLYRPFLRRVMRRSVAGFAARLRRRS